MSQDNSALIPVPFHGATLALVDHNGEPYAAMRPIVEAMGLDWASQFVKLKANRERWGVVEITTPSAGGTQKTLCLPLRKLAGWLMTINPNKVRAELREGIRAYQAECDDVLWSYWTQGQASRSPVPASPAAPPGTNPEHPPITLGDIAIRQDRDGRYCITDVHQAAGGDDQHRPNRWLQRRHTIELIQECEIPGRPAVMVTPRGTFVVKKVVLAYGLSVSLAFHLRISRAFAGVTTPDSQPPGVPLLPSEQQALAAVIGARCAGLDAPLQEQVSAQLWSGLQSHFQIAELYQIPRAQLADAILYLTALPLAPALALPAPAAPEVLTRADRANLDRVLGLMTDHLFHARAWRFAIWRSLRAVTGTQSPQPFEVRHLPAMCAELRRLYAASAAWQDAVHEAEADLLRRVFRLGEDFEQVIAEQRAQQIAEGVERGSQLIVELANWRMADVSKLYARVPPTRSDYGSPDLQE